MWNWLKRNSQLIAILVALAILIAIVYAQLQYAATGESNPVCRFFNSCNRMVDYGR